MKAPDWMCISKDPNARSVLEFRREQLAAARAQKDIDDRIEYLVRLSKDKEVLDVGVVEHFAEAAEEHSWLHSHICRSAASCLGIDVLPEEVRLLKEKGYSVEVHDITKGPLRQNFDVIVVGDVIEHLNAPASLLVNSRKMLKPSGRLVLTTPNPWYANAVIKNVFGGTPFTDSADHVAWFDPSTLCELGCRNGLRLDRYAGVREKGRTLLARFFFFVAPVLVYLGIRPEFFAKTVVYEFVLADYQGEK